MVFWTRSVLRGVKSGMAAERIEQGMAGIHRGLRPICLIVFASAAFAVAGYNRNSFFRPVLKLYIKILWVP